MNRTMENGFFVTAARTEPTMKDDGLGISDLLGKKMLLESLPKAAGKLETGRGLKPKQNCRTSMGYWGGE